MKDNLEKNRRKKIVFITARLPYPANSGRKNVMYNYCRILYEKYNYEITVVSFMEEGDRVEPKPDFIYKVITFPKVSAIRKIVNLFKDTIILRRFPMQVSLYFEPKYKKKIENILEDISPAVVMTDMVRTTEYARDYSGYKIADLDDIISIRYERQMRMDLETINPYGSYLYTLPEVIQSVLSIKWIKRLILNNEIKLLKKYERSVAKIYDRSILVAQREVALLNEELKCSKAIDIPLGVDMEYFGEYFGKIETKKNTIVFLGAMSVAHNEAGVIHFINDILPLVVRKVPNVKFIIVGGGITDNLRKVANEYVELTGRVEDVRKVVGQCEVFVCPLTFGSGIKTKNLEAMAMGVPVVTSTIGAENINAENKKEWLISDDDNEFADFIVSIMDGTINRKMLIDNAYKFVSENFTWKVAEEKMRDVF